MSHPHTPNLRHRYKRQQSPASSSSSFSVPDSSPLFSYASSSSPQNSPWTAGYALQSDGFDETLHLTAQSNSTIGFNVSASSLTLLIPSFGSCKATISINASSPIPACATVVSSETIPFSLYNLPSGVHNVFWNSGDIPSGEQAIFWGVVADRPSPPSGYSNVTIDDAYVPSEDAGVGLKYEGDWTHLGPNTGASTLTESSKLDGNFNKTLAVTQGKGSSLTFSGTGSAIYLYGTVGPDYGSASIALNGQVVAPSLNLTSPWQMSYELLWFQTDLDTSQANKVVMTNLGDKKMTVDFAVLTTDPDTMSKLVVDDDDEFVSSLAGKLVLFLVIPLVVILFLSLLTQWILRKRRSGRPRSRPRSRRHSRESSRSLHPSTKGSSYAHSAEKPYHLRDTLSSAYSHDSFDNVFVSYDEGRQQRLSDRWYSPTTASTSMSPRSAGSERAPPPRSAGSHQHQLQRGLGAGLGPGLAAVPEGVASSPERIRSLLGSNYADTNPPDSRRGTALPAYTPQGTYVSQFTASHDPLGQGESPINAYETLTGTSMSAGLGMGTSTGLRAPGLGLGQDTASVGVGVGSDTPATAAPAVTTATESPASRYPTAEEEKAAQLHLFRDIAQGQAASSASAEGPSASASASGVERTPSRTSTSARHDEEGASVHRGERLSTVAPSDIMSIFGAAAGSERRFSGLTDLDLGTTMSGGSGVSPFLAMLRNQDHAHAHGHPFLASGQPDATAPNSAGAGASGRYGPPTRPTVDLGFLNNPSSRHPFFISPNTAGTGSHTALAPSLSDRVGTLTPGTGTGTSRTSGPGPSTWTSSGTTISTGTGTGASASASGGEGWKHKRNQSNASAWTERSAARPDSAVIPFENFISSLNAAAREEAARTG